VVTKAFLRCADDGKETTVAQRKTMSKARIDRSIAFSRSGEEMKVQIERIMEAMMRTPASQTQVHFASDPGLLPFVSSGPSTFYTNLHELAPGSTHLSRMRNVELKAWMMRRRRRRMTLTL
jgi:hypothetical protein